MNILAEDLTFEKTPLLRFEIRGSFRVVSKRLFSVE